MLVLRSCLKAVLKHFLHIYTSDKKCNLSRDHPDHLFLFFFYTSFKDNIILGNSTLSQLSPRNRALFPPPLSWCPRGGTIWRTFQIFKFQQNWMKYSEKMVYMRMIRIQFPFTLMISIISWHQT